MAGRLLPGRTIFTVTVVSTFCDNACSQEGRSLMDQHLASWHERIVVDPEVLVGKPVIAGPRIPVSLILNLLAHGYDVNRVLEAYPILSQEDVQAALAYAQERLDREEIRLS